MLPAAARRPSASCPLARAWASATCASAARSSSRASSSVPTTWNAKSLSIRTPDAVARRRSAVRAAEHAVVDRLRGAGEPVAVERPIDDRRDPPAGDRVLAQLEQPGRHVRLRPRRGPSTASTAARLGAARSARPPPSMPSRPASAAAKWRAAVATDAVVGRSSGRPSSAARSRSRRRRACRTGRSGRSRRGRRSTFRAIPW